ncbi:aminotransferase class I/II-fold pyridoxal phosphate-dependent enzyme [Pedobacter sp. AW31-3R]|uniref:aminotransferase class I/II-fold pyridoxal phosphate-dependent enzyme n=1 Tax=Pedobacter sp. AW31-3R TaxID=3445781 RepID=UPI003F9F9726
MKFPHDCGKHIIAMKIAGKIEESIRSQFLQPGAQLPPTRAIAAHFGAGVSKSTVDLAWRILKEDLKLIVTRSGHGTHVVSVLPEKKQELKDRNVPKFRPRGALFNKECILPTDNVMKGLDNEIFKGARYYSVQDDHRLGKILLPSLVNNLLTLVNEGLCTAYRDHELYYMQGYQQLIHHICRALLTPRKIFVLADTASVQVADAVTGAGFKWVTVKTDASGMIMESLESVLEKGNVGMVYVRSRSIVPCRQILGADRIDCLLELQKKYGFILIDDDRYAGFQEHNRHLLMDKAYDRHAKVIYIRPVSRTHPDLSEINIVVARRKMIGHLRSLFQKVGKLLNMRMSRSLNILVDNGLLTKYEYRMHRQLQVIRTMACNTLLESGLWKKEGLFQDDGFFFYLELKNGMLPPDIHELLLDEHIFLMETAACGYNPGQSTMILSIAAYLDGQHLIDDIKRLNSFILLVMKLKNEDSNHKLT